MERTRTRARVMLPEAELWIEDRGLRSLRMKARVTQPDRRCREGVGREREAGEKKEWDEKKKRRRREDGRTI